MSEHTPTPWTYRDVSGAGLEICAPVYRVTGVELPRGMPEAPIMTFQLTAPQNVLVAAERWVQFEPQGWSEMQEANAAFIVKAVNKYQSMRDVLVDVWFHFSDTTDPTLRKIADAARGLLDDVGGSGQ